jgi:Fe-S cluster assembly protein SufD
LRDVYERKVMTLAVIKSKAELALVAQFEAVRGRLPGEQDAIVQLRRDAIKSFEALGLPSRRSEAWKYTDLRARLTDPPEPVIARPRDFSEARLKTALGNGLASLSAVTAVFFNGHLVSWSNGPLLSDDPSFTLTGLRKALGQADAGQAAPMPSRDGLDDASIALNLAFMTDGGVLGVPDRAKPGAPIHLIYFTDLEQPGAVTTRSIVDIGAGAEVTILESHVGIGAGPRQTNHVSELRIGAAAKVAHIKLLNEGPEALHLSSWLVDIAADADYRGFQLSASPKLARNQGFVTFKGEHAAGTFNAAFLARHHEHIDTTLIIDHAVPKCTSRELIKCVLDDEARGVFQGKVIVRPDAQKSDGKQMAKALLLSETAEFDSKPELEIYADDVVCGHGSTSAAIDDDHMFYLRARGIPEAEARALLVEAFTAEALDTIDNEPIREALKTVASAWLAASSAAGNKA